MRIGATAAVVVLALSLAALAATTRPAPALAQADQIQARGPAAVAGAGTAIRLARERGRVRLIATLAGGGEPGTPGEATLRAARGRLERRMLPLGVREVAHLGRLPFSALEVDARQLDLLLRDGGLVERVREDRLARPSLVESVPLVGGDAARAAGATGEGWAVAVLDTGVASDHPFLAGKVLAEACFSSYPGVVSTRTLCPNGASRQLGPGAARPCGLEGCDHGTHVAGIAAGAGRRFSGVAPGAGIVAVQVFSDVPGCGVCAYFSDIIRGLDHVAELARYRKVAAANLSLSAELRPGFCDDEPIKLAIDALRAQGVLTVVAAGNDGAVGRVAVPGCVSTALTVGATYDDDPPGREAVAYYSNSGRAVDLLAPGSYIRSAVPGGGFAVIEGTSMAAPHVAGALAALRSKYPNTGADRLETALEAGGPRLREPVGGLVRRRLDLAEALRRLGGEGS